MTSSPLLLCPASYITGGKLAATLLLVFLGLIINFLPEKFQKLPLALISILVVTGVEWAVVRPIFFDDGGTTLVEDMASLESDFLAPSWDMTNMPSVEDALKYVVPTAVYLCVIGLTESLMTLQRIDEMLPASKPGNGKLEVIAQGLGNVVCGCFGAMGGCAMIGQSMINVRNGGVGRLAGIFAGRPAFVSHVRGIVLLYRSLFVEEVLVVYSWKGLL